MDKVCGHCGALHWVDERANRGRQSPRFETCCKQGAVSLNNLREPPALLRRLLTTADPESRKFRKSLRQYNAAFAFTSVNCNQDKHLSDQPGVTSFNIHGELYHLQGPLQTAEDSVPQYAQLFFFDPVYAAEARSRQNPQLCLRLLQQLTDMLHEVSPYVQLYRTAKERLDIEVAAGQNAHVVLSPRMELYLEKTADRRRENLPTSNEVAVIIPDEYGESGFRDIVLTLWNPSAGESPFTSINSSHGAYMPLHYVLLFPGGDAGWNWAMRLQDPHGVRKKLRVHQRAFYRFRLHTRANEFSTLFYSERLFQQYVVDAWAACDQNTLNWIRHHQSNIQSDLYNGLADSLVLQDTTADTVGHHYILPSSFMGGPRFMAQLFQDSMAIVQHFG